LSKIISLKAVWKCLFDLATGRIAASLFKNKNVILGRSVNGVW
jgi:hypothetical protein